MSISAQQAQAQPAQPAKKDDTLANIIMVLLFGAVAMAIIAKTLPIMALALIELVTGTIAWLLLVHHFNVNRVFAVVIVGFVPALLATPSLAMLAGGVPFQALVEQYADTQLPFTPSIQAMSHPDLWRNPFTAETFAAYWEGVGPLTTLTAPVLALAAYIALMITTSNSQPPTKSPEKKEGFMRVLAGIGGIAIGAGGDVHITAPLTTNVRRDTAIESESRNPKTVTNVKLNRSQVMLDFHRKMSQFDYQVSHLASARGVDQQDVRALRRSADALKKEVQSGSPQRDLSLSLLRSMAAKAEAMGKVAKAAQPVIETIKALTPLLDALAGGQTRTA
jgi:hypothetical protein